MVNNGPQNFCGVFGTAGDTLNKTKEPINKITALDIFVVRTITQLMVGESDGGAENNNDTSDLDTADEQLHTKWVNGLIVNDEGGITD